jgi:hypothetical protein
MHHIPVTTNYPWLPHNADPDKYPTPDRYRGMVQQPLGDVKARYDEYMQACADYYNAKKGGAVGTTTCIANEEDRIQMTLRQPSSMRNYTDVGYRKIRAPDHVFRLLKDFWEKNKEKRQPEKWSVGNIYTNHWLSPSFMVILSWCR